MNGVKKGRCTTLGQCAESIPYTPYRPITSDMTTHLSPDSISNLYNATASSQRNLMVVIGRLHM